MNDDQHKRFEELLDEALGENIRGNDVREVELWSALAGMVWQGPQTEQVRYSMRSAGEVVAQIRKEGEYTDWYMSGPSGEVAGWIAAALARHGWTWVPA
jgi:hypothetical protein